MVVVVVLLLLVVVVTLVVVVVVAVVVVAVVIIVGGGSCVRVCVCVRVGADDGTTIMCMIVLHCTCTMRQQPICLDARIVDGSLQSPPAENKRENPWRQLAVCSIRASGIYVCTTRHT